MFKLAKVIPIYKSGDRSSYNNYRPISIIPVRSKIFEKLINKQIINYFENNTLFSASQYGFRKGYSTVKAIESFIKKCFGGVESGFSVSGHFFDLTKAFDTISHDILLGKLKYYGFSDNGIRLMSSYLNNRYQAVNVNGNMSEYQLMSYGVPQGSILGPVLFIIYINDLPSFLNNGSTTLFSYLYADDLAILNFDTKNGNGIQYIETTKRLNDWCNANKLSLNKSKTVDMTFKIGTAGINIDNSIKFLGLYIDSNLGWQSHINHVAAKISKNIFVVRMLKQKLCKKSLLAVYYGCIYSYLNYGILLWGNHSSSSKLFILQKRVVRIICGAPLKSHCRPLFAELGVLTLPSMFVLSCLVYIKENINLYNMHSEVHQYMTRNNNNICLKKCKFTSTQKNFETVAIKLYNSLPINYKNLNTSSLLHKLKQILITNPLYEVGEFYSINLS